MFLRNSNFKIYCKIKQSNVFRNAILFSIRILIQQFSVTRYPEFKHQKTVFKGLDLFLHSSETCEIQLFPRLVISTLNTNVFVYKTSGQNTKELVLSGNRDIFWS